MPRPARPTAALAAAILLALTGTTGCSSDDGNARDDTVADAPGGSSTAASSATSSSPGTWPAFAPQDYTYRLRVLCYCPRSGPVAITVTDGAVTEAVIAAGAAAGDEAPEFARLTINDILDAANEAETGDGSAEVTWPDGSDHPTTVAIDRIQGAVDDEVTYRITDVVSAG